MTLGPASRWSRGNTRVTLMDVAGAVKMSVKTVSLALRGAPTVARETAQYIQDTAVRLGYRARKEKKGALGLTAAYIHHIAYGELIGFIRELAFSYDYVTLIGETAGDPEAERRLITEFSRRGVDGLILVSPRIPNIEIEKVSTIKQPVVTVHRPLGNEHALRFGSLEIDNEAGAYRAVRCLVKKGHRAVAYLAGRLPSSSEQQRRRGYFRALQDCGVPQVSVVNSS